jgi:chromate reductase
MDVGAEGQAGTDDGGLARLHWWRARAAANERDARIDPGTPGAPAQIVIGGVHEKVCDGRLVDEATLRFALAGVDDLLEEIRAARFVRAAA